jgi:hypothetical protein
MRNALLVVAVALVSTVAGSRSPVLSLTMQSRPDPTNLHSDSHLYLAIAKNGSRARLYLPAAKLSGGYAGEGTFFPCVVEINVGRAGAWKSVDRVNLENISGERGPVYVRLDPGKEVEVCRALLPAQGGSHGTVARFVLLRDWNVDAPLWVASKDFKVD